MLSSHARRQAQAQSQVAFKLQFIGTVCESCARSFTYVPHMGIRHFTFVFKESPSETPPLHSSLSYPTWPAAQTTLVPSCQLSLGLFRSSSWFRFRIRFLFFGGVFLLQRFDSIRCRRRQRQKSHDTILQPETGASNPVFRSLSASSVDSLGQMKMKMKRFGA